MRFLLPAALFAIALLSFGAELATALGDSRLYPARYAPSSPDLAGAERYDVKEEQGVEGILVDLEASGGTVSGTIRSSSNDGLPGVWVTARRGAVEVVGLTDETGQFSLEGVPAGAAVAIRAATDDPNSREQRFAAEEQAVSVVNGESVVLPDWTLDLGGTLRGRVVSAGSATPVPRAEVSLFSSLSEEDEPAIARRVADEDGEFAFRGLPSGSYRLLASPPVDTDFLSIWNGDARDQENAPLLEVIPGSDETESLALPLGATIRGQLFLEGSGMPVGDTVVQAIRTPGLDEIHETVASEFGTYSFSGLASGGYLIYCPRLGRYFPSVPRQEDARSIEVVEGENRDRINIRGIDLGECQVQESVRGVIRGNLDIDFDLVESVWLWATSEEDTLSLELTEPGVFDLDCVPPGDYRVFVVPEGPFVREFHRETTDIRLARIVTVDADTVEGIAFNPLKASWLSGTVRELDGSPLGSVPVEVIDEDDQVVARVETDESGSFYVDRVFGGSGLPAGDYYVRADSTVVGDPDVTPVTQPTIVAVPTDSGIEVSWNIPVGARYRFVLRRADRGETDVEIVRRELGETDPQWWVDRPVNGTYRYVLEIEQFGEDGRSLGIQEVATDWASWQFPGLWTAFPSPWDGRGRLALRGADSPGASAIEIVTVDGRLVGRVPWPAGEPTVFWDGTDQFGRPVPSGVYFLYRREDSERGKRSVTIVVQR